jgi:hypothetical protein
MVRSWQLFGFALLFPSCNVNICVNLRRLIQCRSVGFDFSPAGRRVVGLGISCPMFIHPPITMPPLEESHGLSRSSFKRAKQSRKDQKARHFTHCYPRFHVTSIRSVPPTTYMSLTDNDGPWLSPHSPPDTVVLASFHCALTSLYGLIHFGDIDLNSALEAAHQTLSAHLTHRR